ncbi:efflux RND transporter periplasmic adaptor subunit [Teredinibacter turnerae]|uniref:efflux RND transporter periplasmic adaptor subunit n=1 Tax=Teredinibacter turnerae TaxID=2426 RepID=UPI00037A1560|nr:efflux RND transporter periplasmic adaptor subunit [Teredinibacter turnerae]
MNKYLLSIFLLLGALAPIQVTLADDDDDDEYEEISRINDELSTKVGLVTAQATAGTISQTVTVYGSVTQAPENSYKIYARFPGIIKTVNVAIGDTVKKGDRIATIESNESLKSYPIYAPISGVIVQRHANPGEPTQQRRLLTITNLDTVWVEFRIYPEKHAKVRAGQPVSISINDKAIRSNVAHLIPVEGKPYVLARVNLDNNTLMLTPGLLAKGKIHTNEFDVSLVVAKDAVQELGERLGVFVKEEETYEFAPLVLGKSDDRFVEVLSGLKHDAEYVSENSYLIKADILKSEAEDDD